MRFRTAVSTLIACAAWSCTTVSTRGDVSGNINGIHYVTDGGRAVVPGATGIGIKIEMHDEANGTLFVDGVHFGSVESGDRVRVNKSAEVFINDKRRHHARR